MIITQKNVDDVIDKKPVLSIANFTDELQQIGDAFIEVAFVAIKSDLTFMGIEIPEEESDIFAKIFNNTVETSIGNIFLFEFELL